MVKRQLKCGVPGELVKPSNKYGRWSLQVLFGVSGQKGTNDVLKAYQLQYNSLRLLSSLFV